MDSEQEWKDEGDEWKNEPNEGGFPSEREDPNAPKKNDDGTFSQQVKYSQVAARVPEEVAPGVFSTGALVLQGPHEFIMDFLQRLSRPHQVIARIIMPHSVMPQFISVLQENLKRYEERFGPIQELPTPPTPQKPPTVDEIYEQLKLPDEQLGGTYSNGVMIAHTMTEFSFDFISNFYPRAAVTKRVFLSTPQVPRYLETMQRSYQQFQQRVAEMRARMQNPPDDPGFNGGPSSPIGPGDLGGGGPK